MEPLFIHETDMTPKIDFNPDGILSIQGRSFPLDSAGFFNPVHTWVKEISVPLIHLLIRLEYLNTSSAKQLFMILQTLKDNTKVTSLNIDWYYEEDDEDAYDTGLLFESLINIPLNFYAFAEEIY